MQQRLPMPLSKAKFESLGDYDEETDDDAPTATPSAGDLEEWTLRTPPV